jgi:hypothetical protein
VHGIGPRGRELGPWRFTGTVHGFIKARSSARRSTVQIKNAKGYPLDLIWAVGFDLDVTGASSSGSAWPRQRTGAPWPLAWESSSSPYGSPNFVLILPTRSRLWEELVSPMYSGGNGPQKAVNGEVARAVAGGSEVLVRWSSSFEK